MKRLRQKLLILSEYKNLNKFITRSEAKKLLQEIDDYDVIIIDFFEIEFIGQGFADEMFRVYKNKNPKIMFYRLNENNNIKKMISHVTQKDIQSFTSLHEIKVKPMSNYEFYVDSSIFEYEEGYVLMDKDEALLTWTNKETFEKNHMSKHEFNIFIRLLKKEYKVLQSKKTKCTISYVYAISKMFEKYCK